jgi:malonate transporter
MIARAHGVESHLRMWFLPLPFIVPRLVRSVSLPLAFAGLISQVVPGFVAGAVGLFPEPDRAVTVLNTYALKLAFPALVAHNLLDPGFVWPTDLGFWLVVPLSVAVLLTTLWATRQVASWRPHAGTLALSGMFGNVAYIGLPLGEAVLGEGVRGQLTLLVTVHVVVTLIVGPWMLLRWSGADTEASVGRKVLSQPLVWSPVLGLALRGLPEAGIDGARWLLAPLAGSAGPVVLFMIGLYLHRHLRVLTDIDGVAAAHVVLKLVGLPLCTAAALLALDGGGLLAADTWRMALLLAAMPTGAAAFALASDLHVGEQRTAQAVAASTVASALTLPAVAWWVQ